MSTVAKGSSGVVRASTSPSGLMIHPTPPQEPDAFTRLLDMLNAPERTAATTPMAIHFVVVAAADARGDMMTCTSRAAYVAYVSSTQSSVQMLRPKESAPARNAGKAGSPRSNQHRSQLPGSFGR